LRKPTLRKSDYQIDRQIISTEVGGDLGSIRDEHRAKYAAGVRDSRRGAPQPKVGKPLTLVALAGDPDKLPARRDRNHNRVTLDRRRLTSRPSHYLHARRAPPNGNAATQIYGPPTSPNPIGPGLRFSWIVYRRKVSAVTFRPD